MVPDTHERWPGSKLSEAICEDSRYEVLDDIGHVGVVAVRDELIVSSGDRIASADFRRDLRGIAEPVERRNLGGPRATAATGFERWQLKRPGGLADHVRRLRGHETGDGAGVRVSPDHVIVPAPRWCPASPPRPTDQERDISRFDGERGVDVMVLDAGWMTVPLLTRRGGVYVRRQGQHPNPRAGDTLGTIDGHATFIAGQIAARCSQARIFVVSHPHAVTSETAVAQSLSREGARLHPDLVSCGYAYATLDDVPPFVFEQAIDRLAPSVGVVSPAGNEQSEVPHWPAAFERVIGVAALQGPPDVAKRAGFSNHGEWVTCSTGGVDLVSTFPPGTWELEEVPGVVQDFAEFALWSGTSFATPRVTAQAAADLAAGSAATGAQAAGNVSKATDATTDLGDGGAAGVGRMLKLP